MTSTEPDPVGPADGTSESSRPGSPGVVARALHRPGTVVEILDRIISLALESIDACDEAGLCSDVGVFDTLPSTSLATQVDDLQKALGEGPCVDVKQGVDGVHFDSLADDPRWPRWGPLADQAGLRSGVCYRLFSGDETLAVLHLYSFRPAAFDPAARAQALLFAVHAGLALTAARTAASSSVVTAELRTALETRELIGQAQGILMERERITAQAAFDLLRSASQVLNVKLRVIAQALVEMGDLPDRSDVTHRLPRAGTTPGGSA